MAADTLEVMVDEPERYVAKVKNVGDKYFAQTGLSRVAARSNADDFEVHALCLEALEMGGSIASCVARLEEMAHEQLTAVWTESANEDSSFWSQAAAQSIHVAIFGFEGGTSVWHDCAFRPRNDAGRVAIEIVSSALEPVPPNSISTLAIGRPTAVREFDARARRHPTFRNRIPRGLRPDSVDFPFLVVSFAKITERQGGCAVPLIGGPIDVFTIDAFGCISERRDDPDPPVIGEQST